MKTVSLLMILFVAFVSFAQNNNQNGAPGKGGMDGMGNCKMDSTMECNMMRMHMFAPKTAFATTDGGIVVIVGNKIMKYDKDLKLKKEVELTVDSTAMKHMMRKCPRRSDSTNADTTGK